MTAAEFLARLPGMGVRVWADGASVRCSAPAGLLTPALREEIAACKAEILALLGENGDVKATTPRRLRPAPRDGRLPLSFAQQRVWFLSQLDPDSLDYTIAWRQRMSGRLQLTALEKALAELTRRHESLRTTFGSDRGEPFQRIAQPRPVAIRIISLEDVAPVERECALQNVIREETQRPFDLAHGPLFRPVVLLLGSGDHELLMSVHHIVADGWSVGIINRELLVLYDAFVADRPSPLPELPIQYADFACWQREWLVGELFESHRRYWLERLRARPAPLELQTDYPRPRRRALAGASYEIELPRSLADALRELGRREGATLFMTLLAGFKALLSRYTGHQDILVATAVANRDRVELESVVGFFANTLVLRTDVSGDPTFRRLLARERTVCLGAYAHQDMPFERLIEELNPERVLGQNPLVQIGFVFQGAVSRDDFAFVTVASPFDLSAFVRQRVAGTLSVTLEYRSNLFEQQTISRLASHYRALLEGAAAHPDLRLSELPLLDEAEARRILTEWNATATAYPRDRSVPGLFEDQVDATPEAIAVEFQGMTLSYRELDRRANRLAHRLRELGVRAESLVGVWMDRSVETIVALLGILKAGCAYAPFDLLAPPDRLGFMLSEAKIDIVLTETRMLARLPVAGARVICLDVDGEMIAGRPDTRLESPVQPDGLAYVMYTSGSTGEPKGVAVTHRGVVRLVKETNYAHFGPDEVFLQLAPLSFDASTFEIWGALLTGGRLAIAPPGVLSLEELGAVLSRHRVTTLWLTAGLFHQVVNHRVEILRPLRQLLAGGDVLSPADVARVRAALPRCRLINGYGPTEGTTFTCCHVVPSTPPAGRSVPIGRPIANTRVYVLDRYLRPVPVGVPGELWIAGDGLARGYVGRPELTAEHFVVHRLSETIEERLYRSGDVVRWLGDGTLEFLGRLDDQVKVRGYRVELGEVEAALARHPGVREAAVVARHAADGERRLVGYIVGDGSVDSRDLREFLGRKLPDYMIPAALVALDRLPLTANGKVDRQALPEPEVEAQPTYASVEPRDELERQLLKIWQDVLPVGPVGIRDNFFDLGGHSLLAVRMFARLEGQLRTTMPLASLFQAPTIEGLATLIRERRRPVSGRSLVAIQPTGSRPPVFGMPGVGGNVLGYNALARLLGPDQPFYALQSRGLDGSEAPLTRVEDIAAGYLREIREVQPEGPYYLVGTCMGGVVAYEMALQLSAAGQEVGLLGLVETWLPVANSGPPVRPGGRAPAVLYFVASRLRSYVRTLGTLGGRQRLQYLLGRLKTVTQMVAQRDVFRGNRTELHLQLVTQANLVALQQYEPRVYSGRAVLFRAEGRKVAVDDDGRLAWRQLIAGGLEIQTLPGEDSGLMLTEPHVRALARQLKACIERALPSPATVERA